MASWSRASRSRPRPYHRGRRPRGACLLICALLAAGPLAACASEPTQDALEQPVKDAAAAVASTEIAVGLRAEGRTTSAAASTLAGDMLDELDSAAKDLHALEARSPGQRRALDEAAAAVAAAQLAVLRARDALAHDGAGPALEGALAELRASGGGLEALEQKALHGDSGASP